MTVSTVPEKHNNKFESIIKTNKGEGVTPYGYIYAIAEAVSLKKQKICSDRDEGSFTMDISLMVDSADLKKYIQA